jgi:hypothetical protein
MEATNISIKQASSVSINIETLTAILQGAWQSTKRYCNVGALTLPRLYRQYLKMVRAISKVIDAHTTLSNLWIGGWTAACIYLIFMYA